MNRQAKLIQNYLLKHIEQHPQDIVAVTAAQFAVTRTTVHRHLHYLLQKELILKSGTTRNIKYYLKSCLTRKTAYDIKPSLSEFTVLKADFDDIFKQFNENIYDIYLYGFTEIFNNAIDHSQGKKVIVSTEYANEQLSITIADDGIGLFKTIYDYFQLSDMKESVLQLTKGKITTNPARHTGEGIFFTSRAFDRFEIYANNLHYFRDNVEQDWGLESLTTKTTGTRIVFSIHRNSRRKLMDLFKRYQSPEDLTFSRTEILVKLSQLGNEPLISRSQAKRIIFGLEKFRHIILDFSSVRLVGQGFVDEIFRVFANNHPEIVIDYIHADSDVTFMIERSLGSWQKND